MLAFDFWGGIGERMSEYIITKRTECERCSGGLRKGMEHGCLTCEGSRVVEYPVDADEWLLDRLKALRFTIASGNEKFYEPFFKD